ncbi:TPA: autotransporter outer membrane beta-barrel domain-containing protein [Yersinia enterocolitica]|nr:autotransporter outer membrane beta-barrel domain-containing protein [Yersinia enterocolitica]
MMIAVLLSTGSVAFSANSGALLNGDMQAATAGSSSVALDSNATWHGSARNIATLAMDNNARWTGAANNTGAVSMNGGSLWQVTNNSDIESLALNDSTLAFSTPNAGVYKTLTINGDYAGNNSQLILNTKLGDDSSAMDKLVVRGDTSGHTDVVINNIGGHGAQTVQGIEIVQVGGNSQGTFANSQRIVAGAYDYFVRSGSTIDGANAKNWYLSSDYVQQDPTDPNIPELPTDPRTTPDPTGTSGHGATPRSASTTPTVRPEAGSYIANMAAAAKLFNLRLEDREGHAENASIWLRQQGDRTKFNDATGQIKTSMNSYVIQGGGEVAQTQFGDTDRLGVGLMLGYGESDSKSNSGRTGYHSKGNIDGYSGGVYATWYQDAKNLNGWYINSWLQYSSLKAEVDGEQLSGEKYDVNGLSVLVESGYRMPVYHGENGDVFVTPQAQVIWNGIRADDHTETNGTHVTSNGNNNVQTRLGVKLSRDSVSDMDKGKDKLFTTYVEANWLHNTEQAEAVMDGIAIKQAGNSNVGELKLGAEGQLTKHANLWANVAQQIGDKGYSDTALTVGFKYAF